MAEYDDATKIIDQLNLDETDINLHQDLARLNQNVMTGNKSAYNLKNFLRINEAIHQSSLL